MKFIADAMLGKLAKRLRFLGFDVLYDSSWDDNEIIRRSLDQNRVILTRDHGLAGRPLASNHLFIRSENIKEQLNQILPIVPSDTAPLTRCSVCNEQLVPVDRDDIADIVPDHVLRSEKEFHFCPQCGRVYWRGTHVTAMEQAQKNRPGKRRTGGP